MSKNSGSLKITWCLLDLIFLIFQATCDLFCCSWKSFCGSTGSWRKHSRRRSQQQAFAQENGSFLWVLDVGCNNTRFRSKNDCFGLFIYKWFYLINIEHRGNHAVHKLSFNRILQILLGIQKRDPYFLNSKLWETP